MSKITVEGYVKFSDDEWAALLSDTMRLDTKHGEKVIFAFPGNGYPCEGENAMKAGLALNGIYTVREMEVYDSSSRVWLEEVPHRSFNTVLFANAPEQPE